MRADTPALFYTYDLAAGPVAGTWTRPANTFSFGLLGFVQGLFIDPQTGLALISGDMVLSTTAATDCDPLCIYHNLFALSLNSSLATFQRLPGYAFDTVVNQVTPFNRSHLVVGGLFTFPLNDGTIVRNVGLVRINHEVGGTGGVWDAMAGGVNGIVYSFDVVDDQVWVAGDFVGVGGVVTGTNDPVNFACWDLSVGGWQPARGSEAPLNPVVVRANGTPSSRCTQQ